ncbi:leucine-rich_repeat-containing protein [Hexamita inflata]|uniref:Leucine-rich repeat-containing protein n=1 Tax=Hexamita inflata TaxID=28002 RepID=A0AA86V6I3_9EUKA|nr:leucine-rich repeat-containing protein [Hexamita inflata]
MNKISDISPIYNNNNLVELNIAYNHVNNLNNYNQTKHGSCILKGLTELGDRVSVLCENELQNISDLRYMKNLLYVNAEKNSISDVQPLSYISKLQYLNLDENLVENIWPLKHCALLTELHLSSNKIVDISVIRYLNLEKLFFQFNSVVNAQELLLYNNNIQDIKSVIKQKQSIQNNPTPLEVKQSEMITAVFGSNDQNQNLNVQIQNLKLKYKELKQNIQNITEMVVTKQISFTQTIVQLFQSIQ